jgi:hypothetical protein
MLSNIISRRNFVIPFLLFPNISWDNLRAHGWMLICTSLEGATAYGGASLANRSLSTSDVYPWLLVLIRHISVPVGPRQTYIRECWSTPDISVSVGPRQTYISVCWSTPDIHAYWSTSDISVPVGPRQIYPCLLVHIRHITVSVAGFESMYSAFDLRSGCCHDQVNI